MTSNYWTNRGLSRRSFVRAAGAGGLAAGAFALAGCGDDDGKPSATTAPQSGGTTASANTSAAAVPSKADLTKLTGDAFFKAIPSNPPKDWKDEDVKMGGTLVRAHNQPGHFDWILVSGGGYALDPEVLSSNRLLRYYSGQGSKTAVLLPEIEPDLAVKWEKPDDTTLLLTLAPNVNWQNVPPLNGRPLTVDDIKFTFDRGKNYPGSAFKVQYSMFTSVDAVGPNQVRLKLGRVNPLAEHQIAQCRFSIISPEIGSNPDLAKTKLVGTGPFILGNVTPNQLIEFKKNPAYFKKDALGRARPYLDSVNIQYFATNDAAVSAFAVGKVDTAYSQVNLIGPNSFDDTEGFVRRLPNAMLQLVPSAAPSGAFVARWSHPAWKDIRFRRALNMLMDREGIAKQLFKGQATYNPYFPWPVLFDAPPTLAQLGPWFKYDLKEAKALLDATGLGGNTYEIEYQSSASTDAILVLLQQAAAQIGLKLQLQAIPTQVELVQRQLAKQFKDFTLQLRGVDYIDPAATAPAFFTGGGRNTVAENSDQEFDAIWAKLEPATGDARKQLAKQMWDRQLDQVYEIITVREHTVQAYHPRMKNYLDTIWSSRAFGLGQADAVWLDPSAKL